MSSVPGGRPWGLRGHVAGGGALSVSGGGELTVVEKADSSCTFERFCLERGCPSSSVG